MIRNLLGFLNEIGYTASLAAYMISPSADTCDDKSISVYQLLKGNSLINDMEEGTRNVSHVLKLK